MSTIGSIVHATSLDLEDILPYVSFSVLKLKSACKGLRLYSLQHKISLPYIRFQLSRPKQL